MTTVNLGKLEVSIGSNTTELEKGESKAKASMASIGKSFDTGSAAIVDNAKRIGLAIAGAMTGAAIAVKTATEHFNGLKVAAQQVGLSIDQMSRLSNAAGTLGINTESLSGSMLALSRRMTENDWLGEGTRTFNALGISVNDSSGKLKSMDAMLVELAAKFSTMKDSVQKSALVMTLLGDQGTKLLALAGNMEKLKAESDALGATVDEKTAKAFNELSEINGKLGMSFTALVNRIAKEMAPTFASLNETYLNLSTRTTTLDNASYVLSTTLKVLVTIGEAIHVTFSTAYQTIAALTEAVYNIAKGEFTKAWEAIGNRAAALSATFEGAAKNISAAWSELSTGGEKAGKVLEGTVAPIVQKAEELQNAFLDLQVGARNAYDTIMSDPLTTMKEKMEALEVATKKNIITWHEFNKTMKTVKEQNANNMNDMLSLTSQVLTAMFSKSKLAAVAAATINTYVAITKALAAYPPPVSYAMAAGQAALGFAQVRAITSSSEGSSGSAGSSMAGASSAGMGMQYSQAGAPSAPASGPATQGGNNNTLTVQGLTMDGMFSGDVVRSIANKLLDYQRDGGRVVLQ